MTESGSENLSSRRKAAIRDKLLRIDSDVDVALILADVGGEAAEALTHVEASPRSSM